MAKVILAEYPEIKVLLWRTFRVFSATFLTQLGLGILGVTEFDAFKILIVSSFSAGLVALGKSLRDEFGSVDQKSLIDKMPL